MATATIAQGVLTSYTAIYTKDLKDSFKLARLPLSYLHTLKLCYKLLIQTARLSCNGFLSFLISFHTPPAPSGLVLVLLLLIVTFIAKSRSSW